MKPLYKVYSIDVLPEDTPESPWTGDKFLRVSVGEHGHVSIDGDVGYGSIDKDTFVTWLRKAADAVEKANFE